MSEERHEDYELNKNQSDLLADGDDRDARPVSRLDYKVLLTVSVGIASVYMLMLFVNVAIFHVATDQKSAYYLSIIASNILFALVVLAVKAGRKISWAELGYTGDKFFIGIKDVIKVWLITWVVHIVYMIIVIASGYNPPANELMEILQKPTVVYLIVNIVIIAVAAPFIEEALFRGLLFGSMRPYLGTWTAIIVSAAVFSALHFELYGFVPRFALGVGLGYLYVKYKTIYPAVILHGLNNLLAVLLITFFS